MMDYVWFGRQVDIAGFKNNLVDAERPADQLELQLSQHAVVDADDELQP